MQLKDLADDFFTMQVIFFCMKWFLVRTQISGIQVIQLKS